MADSDQDFLSCITCFGIAKFTPENVLCIFSIVHAKVIKLNHCGWKQNQQAGYSDWVDKHTSSLRAAWFNENV